MFQQKGDYYWSFLGIPVLINDGQYKGQKIIGVFISVTFMMIDQMY